MCALWFFSHRVNSTSLLSIEGRQDLLPSLDRPDFCHSIGCPYPTTPHHEPDLLRPADVIVKQVKALRKNDEVGKFAFGHCAKRLFKTKSRCRVRSRRTNNLNDSSVGINTGV